MKILDDAKFYTMTWDESASILFFTWKETTAHMSDADFQDALRRYAGFSNQTRAKNLLVDVRKFGHTMGANVNDWRITEIVPLYHQAGVEKFAYLFTDQAQRPSDDAMSHPTERYQIRTFGNEAELLTWFKS